MIPNGSTPAWLSAARRWGVHTAEILVRILVSSAVGAGSPSAPRATLGAACAAAVGVAAPGREATGVVWDAGSGEWGRVSAAAELGCAARVSSAMPSSVLRRASSMAAANTS